MLRNMVQTGALLVLVLGISGCGRSASPPAEAAPAAVDKSPKVHLDHAQPKLPTLRLWIGKLELTAEVARTTTEVATGMMYRTNMADNEAMLFVFGRPFQASFYMRNTTVPLSCAYIGPDGTILEIHDLKPLNEEPVMAKTDQVQYVLETVQGWFVKNSITPGMVISTAHGGVREIDWRTLRPAAPRGR